MDEVKPCIVHLSSVLREYAENSKYMEKNELEQDSTMDEEDFKDFYETQNFTLICRVSEKFFKSVETIMKHKAVGMAFEGQKLGRDGTLSLIQVATNSELFIFDMIRLGNEAFTAGLQKVLESEDVMKVIHDCRWIADLLQCQHNISMANVFDSQVANAFVYRYWHHGKWPTNMESLLDCLKIHLNLLYEDENIYSTNEDKGVVWLVRPLHSELIDVAVRNAAHLLKLHHVLLAEMLAEFKAAVDIYLNYSSAAMADMEKCRVSRNLLPIAFKFIHTYVKKKSDTDRLNQQCLSNQSNLDQRFSTNGPSASRKMQNQSSRKRLKVSRQLSQKVKPYGKIYNSFYEEVSSTVPNQREITNTDMVEDRPIKEIKIENECTPETGVVDEDDYADCNATEGVGADIGPSDNAQSSSQSIGAVTLAAFGHQTPLHKVDQPHSVPSVYLHNGEPSLPSLSKASVNVKEDPTVVVHSAQGGKTINKISILPADEPSRQKRNQCTTSQISRAKKVSKKSARIAEKNIHQNIASELIDHFPQLVDKEIPQIKNPRFKLDPEDVELSIESPSQLAGIKDTQASSIIDRMSAVVGNSDTICNVNLDGDLCHKFSKESSKIARHCINKSCGDSVTLSRKEKSTYKIHPISSASKSIISWKNALQIHFCKDTPPRKRKRPFMYKPYKPFSCELCNQRLVSLKSMRRHLRGHLAEKKKCSIYDKKMQDLLGHKDASFKFDKSEGKRIICEVKNKKKGRRAHDFVQKQAHKKKDFVKIAGSDETSTSSGLDGRQGHTDERSGLLDAYKKTSACISDLTNCKTSYSHIGEKANKSNLYKETFVRTATAASSKLCRGQVYLDNLPFKCYLCGVRFQWMSDLANHRCAGTHLSCSECGISFPSLGREFEPELSSLNPIYQCQICKELILQKQRIDLLKSSKD